jgi:hypothetical protein
MTHLLILRRPVLTAVTTTAVVEAETMVEANVDEAEGETMDVVEVVFRNSSGLHHITRISNGLIHHIQISISSGAPRRGSHGLHHLVRIRQQEIQRNSPASLVPGHLTKLMSSMHQAPHMFQRTFKLLCTPFHFLHLMISGTWTPGQLRI